MVESRQGFEQNRIAENQPYNPSTDAEYYNRTNYSQPSQPYSGAVNPNMSAGMPRTGDTQTKPQGQSEKEKNDALSRAITGALIGGTLGSLAAVFAGKRIAQSFNHTSKGLGNAAKTIGEGLLQTAKGLGDAVKTVAEGTSYAVIGGAVDTAKGVAEGATQVASGAMGVVQNTADGVNQVVKSGADALQNTAEGINQAVKTGADAVKNTAEDANQSLQYATDTFKYGVQEAGASQTSGSQYQDRVNVGVANQPYGSEQVSSARNNSESIYASPSDIGVQVNSFDAGSLEEEINRIDSDL